MALSGRLRRCNGIEAIEVFGATEAELAATHGNLDRPFRPWPPVLVPRSLRRPVRGRVDAAGAEIEPLVVERWIPVGLRIELRRQAGRQALNSFGDGRPHTPSAIAS